MRGALINYTKTMHSFITT